MDIRMYDTLNSIPLFQGVSGQDLNRIFDRVHLRIECLEAGEIFVRQDEPNQDMVFLLNGTFSTDTLSPEGTYTFSEEIPGPALLEGDILYGIQRKWSSTYTAKDTCRLLLLSKTDVSQLMVSFEVFRLNYLNTLCTLAARRRQQAWRPAAPTLRERFVQFVTAHALRPSGPKRITIRMHDLGKHLGGTRALISNVLHAMQQDGLLNSKRGHIDIPALELLH